MITKASQKLLYFSLETFFQQYELLGFWVVRFFFLKAHHKKKSFHQTQKYLQYKQENYLFEIF